MAGEKWIEGLVVEFISRRSKSKQRARNASGRLTRVEPLEERTLFSAFTLGDLAVLQDTSASANNTTGSFVELNPTTASQTPTNIIAIPSTGNTALRFSGSAATTGYVALSNDRSILAVDGANSASTSGNTNAVLTRGVGAVNSLGAVTLATTYTGISGNQPRGATTVDNSTWFIGDQGGNYTNSATSPSPAGNFRSEKSFGGTVYVFQGSSSLNPVSVVSAASGGTVTALPGVPANANSNYQDFYLVSSGSNGSTYDVLYILNASSATSGTIEKYSLVNGSWTANGSYSTSFGGFGLTAATHGSGVDLYVTTGTGATANNSVVKLTDNAGYNTAVAVTSANNVTLYTATGGAIVKGIDFAPQAPTPDLSVGVTGPSAAATNTPFKYTITVTNNGGAAASGIGATFTLPAGTSFVGATGTNSFVATPNGGSVTFAGGSLAGGSSATLTVTVTAGSSGNIALPAGAAVVDPTNAIAESNENNNTSPTGVQTVVSNLPDLTITDSGPTLASLNSPFNYALVASNTGTADASNVTVQFTLPAGLTYTGSTVSNGFTATQNGSVITLAGGSLGAGSSATLTISASTNTAGTYNTTADAAVIDPANTIGESNETNNSSTAAVSTAVRVLPVANNDDYTTGASTTLTVGAAQGVSANDTGSGSPLTVVSNTNPSKGTVIVNADGSFTYTPTPGATGDDSFTYTTTDAVQLFKTDLPSLATIGGVTITAAGYGSSLAAVPGSTDEYYGLTDRGPNVAPASGPVTNVLPIPDFQPAIGKFKLVNGQAILEQVIGLKASDGTPYNGLVNSQNPTGEELADLQGNILPTSPNGYDSEGLVAMPDGTFWVSDEYGPFVTHFDASGKQIGRLSPFDNSLPSELQNRLANRGMEGLTITPDGSTLVMAMQSALNNPDIGGTDPKKIDVTRIVTYKLATGEEHEYLYNLDNPGTNKTAVSEITAIDNTHFLVDERDGNVEPGAYKKLYEITLDGATDISANSALIGTTVSGGAVTYNGPAGGLLIGGKSIEAILKTQNTAAATATLSGDGITTTTKSLYLDLGGLLSSLNTQGDFFGHDKVEGVTSLNGGLQLVIANDSDFGLSAATSTADGGFQLVQKTLPNGQIDDGEYLIVDLTKLPAATSTATVTIHIPANTPPTFAIPTDAPSVAENAGTQSVNGFATHISAGPAVENGQKLTFNTTLSGTTGNLDFITAPSIDPATGTLTYQPAPNTVGTATFSVTLSDNGGGTDTSSVQTFTIHVADPTSTSIVSSTGGSSFALQNVTFTATVSPTAPGTATPTGQVQFLVNNAVVFTTSLVNGKASYSTNSLPAGADAISVKYLGTPDFLPSNGGPITENVGPGLGLLVLDPTGKGAINDSGSGLVQVTNGTIAVNSSNAASILVSGGATVAATLVDDVGKVSTSGSGKVTGTLKTGVGATSDPFATLAPPVASSLTTQSTKALSIGGNSTVTLNPGVYTGGITVGGSAHVTLNPGVYYLNGGGFTVGGAATVSDLGKGVLLYNASTRPSDTINVGGSGRLTLSGITSGAYQGLAIFQDRSSTAALSFSGAAAVNISGSIYAAASTLTLAGSAGLTVTRSSADMLSAMAVLGDVNDSGAATLRITV